MRDARTSFMAEGRPGRGGAAPGDHLQAAYRLWLPGHQLERAARPWVDPYSFQPVVEPQPNFAAWPFGLAFWPLHRVVGTVGAWNAFVLLSYVGAGAFALLWLLELGVGRGGALVGGLAFALAPYLVAQSSAGHLLAAISMLLPLSLWALERGRTGVAAAALASIPLSGQVHLALGAIPFFLLYAAARRRLDAGAAIGAAAAVAAGLLVWATTIRDSVGETRSFAQVERYSAEVEDFVSRDVRHGLESFVFLGWLTPLLALAGLFILSGASNTVLLGRGGRRGLAFRASNTVLRGSERRVALVLGLGALVPLLLALGANLPGYELLWSHVPGLRSTRVPERLMPIACLCLAASTAIAVNHVSSRLGPTSARAVLPVALALVALDLRYDVTLYRPTAADEDNAAYAALRAAPPGRVLDWPVVLPDRQEASIYLYYTIQAPRERPLGYSTVAPPEADALARRLRVLNCDEPVAPHLPRLRRLGVEYVALHRSLGRPGCAITASSDFVNEGWIEIENASRILLVARR